MSKKFKMDNIRGFGVNKVNPKKVPNIVPGGVLRHFDSRSSKNVRLEAVKKDAHTALVALDTLWGIVRLNPIHVECEKEKVQDAFDALSRIISQQGE